MADIGNHTTYRHSEAENYPINPSPQLDKEMGLKLKEKVRMFIDTDNIIRKLKEAAKEQTRKRNKLMQEILEFMENYNIEDLKSSDGVRLRFKRTQVKEPLSAKMIKERMDHELEKYPYKSKEEIEKCIFERDMMEKKCLRRLKARE